MLSYAWSLSRSYGSQPPARTRPRWRCRASCGKRGARSRSAAGSRFSHRSGGSVMCESPEMRCSRPMVARVAWVTWTSLGLGNGMASSIPWRCSGLSRTLVTIVSTTSPRMRPIVDGISVERKPFLPSLPHIALPEAVAPGHPCGTPLSYATYPGRARSLSAVLWSAPARQPRRAGQHARAR